MSARLAIDRVATADRWRLVAMPWDHARGPRSAPRTLVAYLDLTCRRSASVFARIERLRHASRGDLRVLLRHHAAVPADPLARHAAEVAELAAEQGAFWPVAETLLAAAGGWTRARIDRAACELGVSRHALRDAAWEGRHRARVRRDWQVATLLGRSRAPAVFTAFAADPELPSRPMPAREVPRPVPRA